MPEIPKAFLIGSTSLVAEIFRNPAWRRCSRCSLKQRHCTVLGKPSDREPDPDYVLHRVSLR